MAVIGEERRAGQPRADAPGAADPVSRPARRLQWTITARLVTLVLALAVPLNLVVSAVIGSLVHEANESQRASLLYAAQSVASAVDAELGKYLAIAETLSRSPALLQSDPAALKEEAMRAVGSLSDAWVLVADLDGRQLMNTGVPEGQPLPTRNPVALTAQRRALETHSFVVSDVLIGSLTKRWIADVEVPIYKDGVAFRSLAVVMSVSHFLPLLNAGGIPKEWLAGIMDRQGHYVARVPDNDAMVGKLASAGWRAQKGNDGISDLRSIDGEPIVNANAHSSLSGWTIGIGVEKRALQAAALGATAWALAWGGIISVASFLFAVVIARRITGPLAELRHHAETVMSNPDIAFDPGVPELAELWNALKAAANERKKSEDHTHLLMRELDHRAKNILMVVQSIARQTGATDYPQFLERFSHRVQALATNQDLLIESNWRGVYVDDLVGAQLAHFSDLIGTRILFSGPKLQISPAAAQYIGMALHELSTNAGKYGSLSHDGGRVDVNWSVDDDDFAISWIERDGPVLKEPQRKGFGSKVITTVIEASLYGKVDLRFEPAGLVWRLRCPLTAVVSKPH